METLLQFLESIEPLSIGLKAQLASHLKHQVLPKKEHLLKAGQVCKHIYFINKGLLHCYLLENNIKQTSWLMQGGDVVISVSSFYRQTPGDEYIQALEDTDLYYITHQELQDCYRAFPEFNQIGRVLTEKYYELAIKRGQILSSGDAKKRFLWFVEHFPNLMLTVPGRHIASFLGIKEETLSRIRSNYKMFDISQTQNKIF